MEKILYQAKRFLNRHSSTILTCIGSAGVVATAVMTAKATPKALKRIEETQEEKGEELTKAELVKAVAPVYIPPILVGASTIACMFGANILNQRNQAALMSAYALIDSSYKEYKSKLKELYGEEAHQNIVDSIAVEKVKDVNISASYLVGACDLALEENDSRPVLFYDDNSGRYFEATMERVLGAEYHLNRNYTLRGYSYLNEFYEFLGLEATEYGSVVGWAQQDEGMYWIEFNHRKVITDDGLEIYIIETPFEPTAEFLDWY